MKRSRIAITVLMGTIGAGSASLAIRAGESVGSWQPDAGEVPVVSLDAITPESDFKPLEIPSLDEAYFDGAAGSSEALGESSAELKFPRLLTYADVQQADSSVAVCGPLNQHQFDIVTLALWREARGEGFRGMQAVMNIIQNSAGGNPAHFADACTAKGRFESLKGEAGDDYASAIAQAQQEDMGSWLTAAQVVESAAMGNLEDITGGAYYYMTTAEDARREQGIENGDRKVGWWEKLKAQAEAPVVIGGHVFCGAPANDVVARQANKWRAEMNRAEVASDNNPKLGLN
jgi:hypothetical protein